MEILLQGAIVLAAIILGIKLKGIAIGYTGGLGVLILCLFLGMTPGPMPIDIIIIIMSVIVAISAMQLAGGMDYLVHLSHRILTSNPKYINFLAPTITYFLTIFAGTGLTCFALLPIIVDVAKKNDIRPVVPLSIAVIASQMAVTASPVSAAVIYLSSELANFNWSYLQLVAIWLISTYAAVMLTALILLFVSKIKLSEDQEYLKRLANGEVRDVDQVHLAELKPTAARSVLIFLCGIVCIILYAALGSFFGENEFFASHFQFKNTEVITAIMFAVASIIVLTCKVSSSNVPDTSIFKAGMVSCVCVLGVSWLGNTFVNSHLTEISSWASALAEQGPILVAIGFFMGASFLYSQASTIKALAPLAIAALGISTAHPENSYIIVASFSAVSALFVLPTYPTLLAAINLDYTGTTSYGKYIFDHSLFLPAILAISLAVGLAYAVIPLLS